MLNLSRKYRKGYTGEDIIVERKMDSGMWHITTETVPSRVTNRQISNTAVVIGNGINRLGVDLQGLACSYDPLWLAFFVLPLPTTRAFERR